MYFSWISFICGARRCSLLHRAELLERQRHEHRAITTVSPTIARPQLRAHEVVVDEDEDRLEDADQRRERFLDDVGEDGHCGELSSEAFDVTLRIGDLVALTRLRSRVARPL